MKIQELKELQKVIYDIYYNGLDPIRFKEITGIENYMEELYPSSENKLFGDWISKNFDVKFFLNQEVIDKEIKNYSELFNKVRFYANIPNGKTLNTLSKEFNSLIKNTGNISS